MDVGDISHEQPLPKTYIILLKTAYPWEGSGEHLLWSWAETARKTQVQVLSKAFWQVVLWIC